MDAGENLPASDYSMVSNLEEGSERMTMKNKKDRIILGRGKYKEAGH